MNYITYMYKQVVLSDLPIKRGYCLKKIKHFSYRPTQTKKLGSVKGKQSIF